LQQEQINNFISHKKIKQNVTVNFRALLRSFIEKMLRMQQEGRGRFMKIESTNKKIEESSLDVADG